MQVQGNSGSLEILINLSVVLSYPYLHREITLPSIVGYIGSHWLMSQQCNVLCMVHRLAKLEPAKLNKYGSLGDRLVFFA